MRLLLLLVACSTTPAAKLRNQGVVTIDSRSYKSGGQIYGQGSVTAGFIREESVPFLGCQQKSFGACSAHFDCQPVHGDPVVDGGAAPYASAGTITVEGLPVPVMLTQMTMGMFAGQYTSFLQYTPLYAGGELLTIVGDGAEVPGFVGQITTPTQPTVTAPPPTGTPRVPRTQDLAFRWSGGASGELHVSLIVQQMTSQSGVDCTFAASEGAGVIPASALAILPAGNGSLVMSVRAQNSIATGGWQVQSAATTGPLTTGGQAYEYASVIVQ